MKNLKLFVLVMFVVFATVAHADTRNFTQRYTNNLKGNIKVIGNTVLESIDGYDTYNSNVRLKYVDVDIVGSTFNSSSATINATEAGVDISGARIKWAGLYWQGYLHSNDNDPGIDSQYNISSTQSIANTQILNIINSHSISLQKGTNPADNITPDQVNWHIQYDESNYVAYKYGAFADITSFLQDQSPSAEYTIANIPTREGRTSSGNRWDGLGNYAAWSLVIVYDNNTSVAEKTRNISVFDGYLVLNGATPQIDILVSGFKTPKNAPNGVDSTLSVFAAEGDTFIVGDYLELINEDGLNYTLASSSGTTNFFNSSIEGVDTRNPSLPNNMGIDIHTQPVGTNAGSGMPIKTNHTSATIRIGTVGDHFVPSMAAFATELFSPQLCYDYDVRIGNHMKIPSTNREIHANKFGDDDLTITMLIRSEISDFPIDNSKLNITLSSSALEYIDNASEVSPPDVNRYYSIGDIDSTIGQIGIGRGATNALGGTIDALESTYAKQKFKFINDRFDGTFDIQVEGTILFDPMGTPVPYLLSTSAPVDSPSHIRRCATNPIYDPIWANFNIERTDSDPSQDDEERYPLYTQIAGKDFNVSVVSYKLAGGVYNDPHETNATVELEIIDASTFDNNSSVGYDSTCEEPGAIGDGAFINFAPGGVKQSRIDVQIPHDIPNFDNDMALQSVAFRIWVLSTREANGTKSIVQHSCTLDGVNPGCFSALYQNRILSYDTTSICTSDCQGGGYTAQGCYDCLKENFASPICSRDNFSIRPESFRIHISDNNESNSSTKLALTNNNSNDPNFDADLALAAGYSYALDANATIFNTSNNAREYYNVIFEADTNIENLGDKTRDNIMATLEYLAGSGDACADTTHQTYAIRMQNGKTDENTSISHYNVGDYSFWMLDSNWTNVDQASYPYKNHFGSCSQNDPRPICTDCDLTNPSTSIRNADGKLGCVINSNLDAGDKDDDYVEIPLSFEPYAFDVSGINITLPNNNNFVYTNNDINDTVLRSMSVAFAGNIVAQGKGINALSNFTVGCAARPVAFDINLTMSRASLPLNPYTITTEGGESTYIRRNYENSAGTGAIYDNNDSNVSSTLNIAATEFADDDNGSAPINLYYNFNRIDDDPINPINVTFIAKEANSTEASSSTHMLANYIPRGVGQIDRNIDFYYGRVAPGALQYLVPRSQDTAIPDLYMEVYCNLSVGCDEHNLSTDSVRDPDTWRQNTRHNCPGDGVVGSLVDPNGGLSLIDPNTNICPTNPTSVTMTIASTTARTYDTAVNPPPGNCPPWLTCEAINLTFLGGGGWAGTGKTGLILDTNSSFDRFNKRTEW